MEQDFADRDKEELDRWKVTLVQLVYTICGAMLGERFFAGLLAGTAPLDAFIEVMEKLGAVPDRGGEVMIRFRGRKTGPRASVDLDYVVATDGLRVDLQETAAIMRRRGIAEAHLQGRLIKAWEVFKNYGITSMVIRLPEPSEQSLTLLRITMHLLSRYYQAVQKEEPLYVKVRDERREVPIINDQENQPDPNLTLFAGLNGLSKEAMDELIRKIAPDIQEQLAEIAEPGGFIHLAEILFESEEVRGKLRVPPIRINTIRWAAVREEEVVVSKDRLRIAEAIERVFGRDEDKTKSLLHQIYDPGLDVDQAEKFGRGLELISEFLSRLADFENYREVAEEVRARVNEKISALSQRAFELLDVDSAALKISQPGKDPLEFEVMPEFLSSLRSMKPEEIDVYEKLRNIHNVNIKFSRTELERLATDFRTPLDETEMFLRALRRCFDEQGNFSRDLFAEHGAILALYIDQVFPLLLHYLKTAENKRSRLDLLNCLPTLFEKVEHPRKVVGTLLKDFCTHPKEVYHFDRNLLMLAVQLLRGYRKEERMEIETTPEEVLSVEKGLVGDAVELARRVIGELEEEIQAKLSTITSALIDSLGKSDRKESLDFTPRFLFSLLREFYLLMALIGGPLTKTILGDAALAFGDPQSRYYNQPASQEFLSDILGLFRIVVRGYVRLVNGAEDDRERLKTLKANLAVLISGTEEEGRQHVLRQILGYIDSRLR